MTRYDPARRNPPGVRPVGAYIGETWTSIFEVGTTFDGVELTMDEYLHVEGSYLDAVRNFMSDAGVSTLSVRNAEKRADPASTLVEGEQVGVERVCEIVRSMLRETAWCRLEATSPTFYVHVGFDLYMYIGAEASCEGRSVELRRLGSSPSRTGPRLTLGRSAPVAAGPSRRAPAERVAARSGARLLRPAGWAGLRLRLESS